MTQIWWIIMIFGFVIKANVIPKANEYYAGTCERYDPYFQPHIFCSGIISYDFYVKHGTTKDEMNKLAIDRAMKYPQFIDSGCLLDIKLWICNSIYLPCNSLQPYSTNVEYKRPCRWENTLLT